MADLVITNCSLVKGDDEHQLTLPANADTTAGQAVTPNSAGKWVLAGAATAAAVGDLYLAIGTVKAGEPLTAIKVGIVDVGEAVAALNFAAAVYLSDNVGKLADATGTVSTIVGRVVPGWANSTPDKLLRVGIE